MINESMNLKETTKHQTTWCIYRLYTRGKVKRREHFRQHVRIFVKIKIVFP